MASQVAHDVLLVTTLVRELAQLSEFVKLDDVLAPLLVAAVNYDDFERERQYYLLLGSDDEWHAWQLPKGAGATGVSPMGEPS